jgi:hypothetical protein
METIKGEEWFRIGSITLASKRTLKVLAKGNSKQENKHFNTSNANSK